MSKKFKLLSSTHTQDGRTFSKGDIVTSQYNLDKLFLGKFQVLADAESTPPEPGQSPAAPATAPEAPSAPAKPAAKPGATAAIKSVLGEDVTKNFASAAAAELRVFRKGKSHFVTQPDAVDTALNDEPLTANQVGPFVTKVLA